MEPIKGLFSIAPICRIQSWLIGAILPSSGASLVAQMVKNPSAMQETRVWSLGQEDPLEKGMDTYSSVLAWRIPQAEEPGRLQSMWLQRIRYNWATNTFAFFFLSPKRRFGQIQYITAGVSSNFQVSSNFSVQGPYQWGRLYNCIPLATPSEKPFIVNALLSNLRKCFPHACHSIIFNNKYLLRTYYVSGTYALTH